MSLEYNPVSVSYAVLMKKDSLARRLRFAKPDPREGEIIYPQEADLEQWAAISRHGPLPIAYLAQYGGRTSRANLQRRYLKFYQLGWVERPERQFATFHAHCSHLVYDLKGKARAALGDRASRLPASRWVSFVHQLMQACVTASFERSAHEQGLVFEPRDRFISNSLAITLSTGKLIPDDIFAFRRKDGKRRHFALEIDRNTESIERSTKTLNTWRGKVAAYDEVFRRQLHRLWGFPMCSLLIVTTNGRHAENLRTYIDENSAYPNLYMIAVEETFGANWRVPGDLLRTIEQLSL